LGDGLGMRQAQTLGMLVGDDGIHSIPKAAFPPEGCNLRPEFGGKQFRVENAAVEVDARTWGIAATCSLLGWKAACRKS
jgi:hypothetical protein